MIEIDKIKKNKKDSLEYRDIRCKRYIELFSIKNISPEKDSTKALGDCVDAIIESFILNELTPSTKLQEIIDTIAQVKKEIPKP